MDGRRRHGLDPARYFIVIPNMFGNGLSTSPNNMPALSDHGKFLSGTIYDNAVQQQRLLSELFGATERICFSAVGWSMGGQQALHWGAVFPDRVDCIAPICASAKTSVHNFVFLESVKAALTADPAFSDGWFAQRPERGLRAVARAYAAWAVSLVSIARSCTRSLAFKTVEDFLQQAWMPTCCGGTPTT